MTRFVIKRLLSAIPVLFIVITLVFFMMRIIPGDPASQIMGDDADPVMVEALREKMGLNEPLSAQYVHFIVNTLKGNWGTSLFNNLPVFQNIMDRLEPTLMLTIYSTVISVCIGIPFGIIAAKKRNSVLDYALTTSAVLGLSIPGFWLGLMMVFYLGVMKRWFPVQGYTYLAEGGLKASLYSLTMPAIALSVQHISSITRYTRSMMLDVLNNDYIRTARAKGLIENKVFYKHALKNALAPVITQIGISIAEMMGGSTVTETVFNINGMGKLAYDSLMRRDYPQEQAIIMFVAILFIFTNIVLDIIYKTLDPRIEFD